MLRKRYRAAILEDGLSLKSSKPEATASLKQAARAKSVTSALDWYANRGALVDKDEDPMLNDLRQRAGEELARLHDQAYRRPRVTARYDAAVRNQSATAEVSFVRSETARRRFEEKIRQLPARTRAVVQECVVYDKYVGRSRMERLRCGLDVLAEYWQFENSTHNTTKSVD